jgi:hypothetical protein
MFKKIFGLVVNKNEFRVTTIDNQVYTLYARNFADALSQHLSKFAHEPNLIEPMRYTPDMLVGFNKMKYIVYVQKEVFAIGEQDAILTFSKNTSSSNLLAKQIYPVWCREQ